jgi:dTMP kinase
LTNDSRRGKLILFEGIDGAGKTIQQERAARWLSDKGFSVLTLCEPTHGPAGQKLRRSAELGRLTPDEELNLFLEDRRWNVETNILPALREGKMVLLDRYYLSSMAYQGARGMDPEMIRRKNEAFAPQPDLTFLLDLEPDVALERIRRNREELPNLFEKRDYLRKVREIFLSLKDPNLVRIDAARSVEAVWRDVRETLHEFLKGV